MDSNDANNNNNEGVFHIQYMQILLYAPTQLSYRIYTNLQPRLLVVIQ